MRFKSPWCWAVRLWSGLGDLGQVGFSLRWVSPSEGCGIALIITQDPEAAVPNSIMKKGTFPATEARQLSFPLTVFRDQDHFGGCWSHMLKSWNCLQLNEAGAVFLSPCSAEFKSWKMFYLKREEEVPWWNKFGKHCDICLPRHPLSIQMHVFV